jgi:hypothetical protein
MGIPCGFGDPGSTTEETGYLVNLALADFYFNRFRFHLFRFRQVDR